MWEVLCSRFKIYDWIQERFGMVPQDLVRIIFFSLNYCQACLLREDQFNSDQVPAPFLWYKAVSPWAIRASSAETATAETGQSGWLCSNGQIPGPGPQLSTFLWLTGSYDLALVHWTFRKRQPWRRRPTSSHGTVAWEGSIGLSDQPLSWDKSLHFLLRNKMCPNHGLAISGHMIQVQPIRG